MCIETGTTVPIRSLLVSIARCSVPVPLYPVSQCPVPGARCQYPVYQCPVPIPSLLVSNALCPVNLLEWFLSGMYPGVPL